MALQGARGGEFLGVTSDRLRRLFEGDFLRQGILVFAASMATNVLSYAFNFALSRRLGVENYATVTALIGGFMLFSIPSTAINLIAVKYAAQYHAAGDIARLHRLSGKTLRMTTVAGAAVFFVGVLLQSRIAGFLHVQNDWAITWTLVLIALGIVMPSARGILQGIQDFKGLSISSSLEALLKFILGGAMVYAGFGVGGAMAGWVLGTVITLAYTLFAVRNRFRVERRPARLSLDFGGLLSTIGMVTAATALLTCLSFVDVVLVKHYFGARDAGLYSAANLTGKIVLFVVGFLPTILLPKVVERANNNEPALRLLFQAAAICVLISGFVLAAFSSEAKLVITVLAGRAFLDAAPYVFQYDLAMAMLALLTLVVNFRIAVHRLEFLFPLTVVLALEIVAIVLHHGTLWQVIHTLVLSDAAAVAIACFGLNGRPFGKNVEQPTI